MFKANSYLAQAVTLVLVTTSIVCMASMVSAESGGKWVQSSSSSGCPSSGSSGMSTTVCETEKVCADWDVDGEAMTSCCIDGQYLWTSDFGACT